MEKLEPLAEVIPQTGISQHSLAFALDQSVDCVKIVKLDGTISYVNTNGLCAMQIDDARVMLGAEWSTMWPPESRNHILEGLETARRGGVARFRAACPTARGEHRWWDVTISMLRDESGESVGYLGVSRDVTENQLTREVLEVATRELHHRLKNTYAMIASLLRTFGRSDPAARGFADDMAARLTAIGRAQALFTSQDAPCCLAELSSALVVPFDSAQCPVHLDAVDDVTVPRPVADTIALVVGEMAVNASKHGALRHGGSIGLIGRMVHQELVVHWRERSAAAVRNTHRAGGQGLALIQRIMRARDGAMTIDWLENGLDATLRFTLA